LAFPDGLREQLPQLAADRNALARSSHTDVGCVEQAQASVRLRSL
jgi:hypothetical protein